MFCAVMSQGASLDGSDKLGAALGPVWDAVHTLQGGLRETGQEAREARATVATLSVQVVGDDTNAS